MKIIATCKINPNSDEKLKDLIYKNKTKYLDHHNYERYIEDAPLTRHIHSSWRHPQIILNVLKNPKFKEFDFIINSGHRNLVTNFNITFEEKIKKYMKPEHNIIFQEWELNSTFVPIVLYTQSKGGEIKAKRLKNPYLSLAGE